MDKESDYNIRKQIEEITKDLDTITKMHMRLDELSLQLTDVVHLASIPAMDIHVTQSSSKLMELVNILLNRVELGINELEKRVESIEYFQNQLKP